MAESNCPNRLASTATSLELIPGCGSISRLKFQQKLENWAKTGWLCVIEQATETQLRIVPFHQKFIQFEVKLIDA
jgi:hypothetical protein